MSLASVGVLFIPILAILPSGYSPHTLANNHAATRPAVQPNNPRPIRPATQPAKWVQVGPGLRAHAYFGVWNEDARPGQAVRVARLLPDSADAHFGITIYLDLPEDFSGDITYREKLTLPAPPRTWDTLNDSLVKLHVHLDISPDRKSSTVTERWNYELGERILPFDGLPVANLPTPFIMWDFDHGDPLGDWVMDCWVNDKPVGHFTFKMIASRPGDLSPVVIPDRSEPTPTVLPATWLPSP